MALQTHTLSVGLLQVNCHLLWDDVANDGFVVDPGDDADEIADAVERVGLLPRAVLLTHGHVDHIRAAGALCERYGIAAFLHRDDMDLYFSPDNAFPPWLPAAEGLPEPVGVIPTVPGFTIEVLHTPGHTPGGVCFYLREQGMLFSGDTLFRGSIGRTDFPGGSMADLVQSVRGTLYALPDATRVFPGHNEATTIGEEKRFNPFVRP